MKDTHLPRTRMSDAEVRAMTKRSKERSDARRAPLGVGSKLAGGLAVGAAVGTLLILGGRVGGTSHKGSAAPEGAPGNVPAATINYLEDQPTERATIPEGGGVDNAAYAVDDGKVHDGVRRGTYTETDDIHAGIKAILDAQVKQDTGGTVPQIGEELQVPIVPPANSVPPDAR